MSHVLSGIAGTQYFIFSLLQIWFIERVGRRNSMIRGAIFQCIFSVLICIGIKLNTQASLRTAVAMYFLFYDSFAMR